MDSSSGLIFDLPFGFEDWHPGFQILFFSLIALISEDGTMITASILAGTGQILRSVGFFGAFIGIWLGDFLLYLIAYKCRSWAQRHKYFGKFMKGARFRRYETWFEQRGWQVLIISRFLPGTRVGSFVVAGYLRMKMWPFILITFSSAFVWATIIFLLFERLGSAFIEHLDKVYKSFWLLLLIIAGGFLLFKLIVSLSSRDGRRAWAVRLGKISRWEFWPGWLFYTPVFIHYFYLVLRFRSLTLPTISNPGMENGGFVGESKAQTLEAIATSGCSQSLPYDLIPTSDDLDQRVSILKAWMAQNAQDFPIILKPDTGQRGLGVRLIQSLNDAQEYLESTKPGVICQKPAEGKREAGIFYIRMPDEEKGFIFAATEKIFPELTGDGEATLKELLWRDSRARFQHSVFFSRFEDQLEWIPAEGEKVPLVFAGNHAQGSLFLDGARWISPELEEVIHHISNQIPGFNFGRYDIRFESEEDLKSGKFEIIELNGASSEATNIYDPGNSLISAYRTLFKQWEYAFKVGDQHRKSGLKPIGFFGWLKYYRRFRKDSGYYSVSR